MIVVLKVLSAIERIDDGKVVVGCKSEDEDVLASLAVTEVADIILLELVSILVEETISTVVCKVVLDVDVDWTKDVVESVTIDVEMMVVFCEVLVVVVFGNAAKSPIIHIKNIYFLNILLYNLVAKLNIFRN